MRQAWTEHQLSRECCPHPRTNHVRSVEKRGKGIFPGPATDPFTPFYCSSVDGGSKLLAAGALPNELYLPPAAGCNPAASSRTSKISRPTNPNRNPRPNITINPHTLDLRSRPAPASPANPILIISPQPHISAMNVDTISDFLAEQRDEAPEELQPLILQFEDLWERKLWHQLTNSLLEFFNDSRSAPQRLQFYKVFILKFADKINPLKLVDLALKAASQCRGKKRRHAAQ